MKIKKGFIKRSVGGTEVVVPVGEASAHFNAMITLNGSGSFLWSMLEQGASEQELLKGMLDKYDVGEETALRDIHAFLEKARSAGVLDE